MKAFRDQHRLTVPHTEDFVEPIILPVVTLNAKAIARHEAVVIDLFQIRGTVISIVAVRWPATPRATRDIDLKKNQSFRGKRRRQNMINLTQGCTPTPHFGSHFIGSEQTQRIFSLGRRAAQREFEIAGRFNFDFMPGWHIEHLGLAREHALTLQHKSLIPYTDASLALQWHDGDFHILSKMGV